MFGDGFETSPLPVGHQLSSNHVPCSWMHTRVAGDVWLLVVICSNEPSSSSTKRAGTHSSQHHAEESLQMLGSDCRQEKHSAFVAKVSKTAE